MHRGIAVGVLTLVCLAVVGGTSALADEELPSESTSHEEGAPYVDAGLDQEVTRGDEVLLDGGGTWDDQGDIAHKEWEIEAPDGRTFQPDCGTCWFTSFRVGQVGEYEVTLTVRDEDGNENEDTLYVRVGEVNSKRLSQDSGDMKTSVGGDNGGCYLSHAADAPHTVCEEHGRVKDLIIRNGEIRQYVIDEKNPGIAWFYSDVEYNKKGELLVEPQIVESEVVDLHRGRERKMDTGTPDYLSDTPQSDNLAKGTGLNPSAEAGSETEYLGPGLNPNDASRSSNSGNSDDNPTSDHSNGNTGNSSDSSSSIGRLF